MRRLYDRGMNSAQISELIGLDKEQVEEMIEKLEIDKNKLSLDKVSEIYKKY